LNQTNGNGKLSSIQRVAARARIGKGPNALERFNSQLGTRKEGDCFGTSNVSTSGNISSLKQTFKVRLQKQ
jgi:hypothetical protein